MGAGASAGAPLPTTPEEALALGYTQGQIDAHLAAAAAGAAAPPNAAKSRWAAAAQKVIAPTKEQIQKSSAAYVAKKIVRPTPVRDAVDAGDLDLLKKLVSFELDT